MPRMLLPLQPGEKHELDLLRRETEIPLGVLVYLRKMGFTPVATEVARQHGLLPGQSDAAMEPVRVVAQ